MKAHRTNPALIRVTSGDKTIGHLTPEQFRETTRFGGFLPASVKRFNEIKELRGEPERAAIVIQLENGKTI